MKPFAQIVAAFPGFPTTIGDNPQLTIQYHAPGAGYMASLIAELNPTIHITIYQDSWDGQAVIHDATGSTVRVGPHCLHLTAGTQHWFKQWDGNSSWNWITDHGEPTVRFVNAFTTLMNTLEPHLH